MIHAVKQNIELLMNGLIIAGLVVLVNIVAGLGSLVDLVLFHLPACE
jgi:hypothetical protein